jgi:hypothetical protein
MPIPEEKMDQISFAIEDKIPVNNRADVLRRLFWTTRTDGPNSLILFLGEFKKVDGLRNQNQLVLDFATAQSQRSALGLPDAVIWGATCAVGQFKVYSSSWKKVQSVCLELVSRFLLTLLPRHLMVLS